MRLCVSPAHRSRRSSLAPLTLVLSRGAERGLRLDAPDAYSSDGSSGDAIRNSPPSPSATHRAPLVRTSRSFPWTGLPPKTQQPRATPLVAQGHDLPDPGARPHPKIPFLSPLPPAASRRPDATRIPNRPSRGLRSRVVRPRGRLPPRPSIAPMCVRGGHSTGDFLLCLGDVVAHVDFRLSAPEHSLSGQSPHHRDRARLCRRRIR